MMEQAILFKSTDHAMNLNKMRLNDKWCDVTIQVNDKSFRAHKFVLAANLKYFEILLSSDTFQECKEGVVNMESIDDPDLMEAFIAFAYTGEFSITASTAFKSLKIADYLCEDGIKNACVVFLEENLKEEEAVNVYVFTRAISCVSLMKVAREKIVRNFGLCMQSSDYLHLDYEGMSDIISDGKAQPMECQREIFDRIMRWTVHDVQQRRAHMMNLLSFIDVAKLSADALICYLYGNVVGRHDQHGIFKDVMYHYYTSKNEHAKRAKVLVVIGIDDNALDVWFYDFSTRIWSKIKNLPVVVGRIYSGVVVLRDKLYYQLRRRDGHGDIVFQMLDLTTKQYTTLNSSSNFGNDPAICADDDNFVYLCGGMTRRISNQVLRYNVDTNIMSAIEPMKVKRGDAAAIFYHGYLLVIGGCDESKEIFNSVEKYEPVTKTWTAFPSLREPRHCHAVAILDDKLYACGGIPTNTVEAYDPATISWKYVAPMSKRGCSFLLVAHEGKLLAIEEDDNLKAEVYDPVKNVWQFVDDLSRGVSDWGVRGGLVSTTCVVDSQSFGSGF